MRSISAGAPGLSGYRIGEEEAGLVVRLNPAAYPGRSGLSIWLEVVDTRVAGEDRTAAGIVLLDVPVRIRTAGW